MDANAKAIAKDWRETWENINQIWQLLKGEAFDPEKSPFPALMHAAKEATDLFWNTLLEKRKTLEGKNFWEEFFKEIFVKKPLPTSTEELSQFVIKWLREHTSVGPRGHAVERLLRSLPTHPAEGGAVGGAVPFASLGGSDGLDDNTRELRRLNDQLYAMLHPPETSSALATRGGGDGTDGAGAESKCGSGARLARTIPRSRRDRAAQRRHRQQRHVHLRSRHRACSPAVVWAHSRRLAQRRSSGRADFEPA